MCPAPAHDLDRSPVADPAMEIEVTPEMIEAGLDEYALFSSRDPGEWVVAAIYRAMEKIRLAHGSGGLDSSTGEPEVTLTL
jgi:hypothetical protein